MFSDDCETCRRNVELLAARNGPWTGEPNRLEFRHAGFACVLHRGGMGGWCGYVGLPPGHPLHGKTYGEIEEDVDVHGGLTYSEGCRGHVCHKPGPDEPENLWWLGFDTGHFDDMSPRLVINLGHLDLVRPHECEVYRTMAWTKRETKRLARQLAAMEVRECRQSLTGSERACPRRT